MPGRLLPPRGGLQGHWTRVPGARGVTEAPSKALHLQAPAPGPGLQALHLVVSHFFVFIYLFGFTGS